MSRAMDALERRGLRRGVAETARELARRADAAHDPGAIAFTELVERCYASHYGAEPVPRRDLERLLHLVVKPPVRQGRETVT